MSIPARRWGRAGARWRWRCRLEAKRRPSPTRMWLRHARRLWRRWANWGASCVDEQVLAEGSPRVIVAGATGFAGALAAHLLWRHPGFELAAVTGRSDLGRGLDDLYPRYR